ncbi:GNAT family N-acetyltransferase [Longispora sp. NPDC051575]|uniref:GNAT family N-acetyltransferase n=1 Tax=Longispora sp. NPDC051575 TaxID=3154943 RepID=UPI00343D53AC
MDVRIRTVGSDEDREAWRQVRIAVIPEERCASVAEMRARTSPHRLLLLAEVDGELAGSGIADLSDVGGQISVAPRVLPGFRRRGVGTALLYALAEHAATLGRPRIGANADDPGSVAFAVRHGFAEVDRQVEQIRAVGDEPLPAPLPGIEIVTAADRPELWPAAFEAFGREVTGDFALDPPILITQEQWVEDWLGDQVFLAVVDGEVIGCAGFELDTDRPERAEYALTAVRRDWRGRGVASYLKRLTLWWAARNGITEVYTWTQRGNADMRQLNEHLGFTLRQESVTVRRDLPL